MGIKVCEFVDLESFLVHSLWDLGDSGCGNSCSFFSFFTIDIGRSVS